MSKDTPSTAKRASAREQIDRIDDDPDGSSKLVEDTNGTVRFPGGSGPGTTEDPPVPSEPKQPEPRLGRPQGQPSRAQAETPRVIPEAGRPDLLHVMFTPAGGEPTAQDLRFQLVRAGADTDRENALTIAEILAPESPRKARVLEDRKTIAVTSGKGKRVRLTLRTGSNPAGSAYHIAGLPGG